MRHRNKGRKFGRDTKHRIALFRNLVQALVAHNRIVTTLPKAKEIRGLAERMVTLAKKGAAAEPQRKEALKRLASKTLIREELVEKLFNDYGVRFAQRVGGYTRIYKLGFRKGDGAEMAMIEYLDADKAPKLEEPETEAASK